MLLQMALETHPRMSLYHLFEFWLKKSCLLPRGTITIIIQAQDVGQNFIINFWKKTISLVKKPLKCFNLILGFSENNCNHLPSPLHIDTPVFRSNQSWTLWNFLLFLHWPLLEIKNWNFPLKPSSGGLFYFWKIPFQAVYL